MTAIRNRGQIPFAAGDWLCTWMLGCIPVSVVAIGARGGSGQVQGQGWDGLLLAGVSRGSRPGTTQDWAFPLTRLDWWTALSSPPPVWLFISILADFHFRWPALKAWVPETAHQRF